MKKQDKVFTYVVDHNGKVKNNEELAQALEEGYKIVDVKNSTVAGGNSSGANWAIATFVTVIVTNRDPAVDAILYNHNSKQE